jgi:protein-S-isoprenylcysteine O-methyltransferase Ste14
LFGKTTDAQSELSRTGAASAGGEYVRKHLAGVAELSYRYRAALVLPPLLFSLFWIQFETDRDWLLWPLGVALFSAGLMLRFWAQEHLHYRIRIPMKFIRSGPYAIVRNPIYIGNSLICLGLTVTSELLWMVPVVLIWCGVLYAFVVRYEERMLAVRYGEPYCAYLREVPRWWPRSFVFQPHELVNRYAWPSALAEAHNLLLLLPFILKELLSR